MLRLKAVQVVDGTLRECCGLEDCAGVVFERLQPGGDIGRVLLLDLGRDVEIGAKERRAQFGDEFLTGVALVTPDPTAEVTIQPRRMFRAMDALVRERGVETFRIAKALEGW